MIRRPTRKTHRHCLTIASRTSLVPNKQDDQDVHDSLLILIWPDFDMICVLICNDAGWVVVDVWFWHLIFVRNDNDNGSNTTIVFDWDRYIRDNFDNDANATARVITPTIWWTPVIQKIHSRVPGAKIANSTMSLASMNVSGFGFPWELPSRWLSCHSWSAEENMGKFTLRLCQPHSLSGSLSGWLLFSWVFSPVAEIVTAQTHAGWCWVIGSMLCSP